MWCLFKVNNKDTRAMCDICSKLTLNALDKSVSSFGLKLAINKLDQGVIFVQS